MRDVYDFAKYFIKCGADSNPNTYDGNMKLQKLLVFANMFHIAKYNTPLYNDEVYALKDGYVVEKVRQRYQYDYIGFKRDSEKFEPNFNHIEYDIVTAVLDVFGNLSALKLSQLSHTLKSWERAYNNGLIGSNYHDKKKSIVNFNDYPEDLVLINKVLDAHTRTQGNKEQEEVINGIRFYYNNMTLTEDIFNQLNEFSKVCEDDVYTVYLDNGKLVIY